jgi:alkaline phosphatase
LRQHASWKDSAPAAPAKSTGSLSRRFPWTALSRTYNTDSQTPDSAGTMSAIITGSKTRMGMISRRPLGLRRLRSGRAANRGTLLEIAEAAGCRPAWSARPPHPRHAARPPTRTVRDRGWESDAELPPAAARRVAATSRGSCSSFPSATASKSRWAAVAEFPARGGRSRNPSARPAQDGRDLVRSGSARIRDGATCGTRRSSALDLANTRRLLGLFEPDHMNYEHDGARRARRTQPGAR